eukprot:IDg6997t1
MSTAVRAAKAALKVTGGQEKKETPRREALLVSAYVFLREGDLDGARNVLHQLRQRASFQLVSFALSLEGICERIVTEGD